MKTTDKKTTQFVQKKTVPKESCIMHFWGIFLVSTLLKQNCIFWSMGDFKNYLWFLPIFMTIKKYIINKKKIQIITWWFNSRFWFLKPSKSIFREFTSLFMEFCIALKKKKNSNFGIVRVTSRFPIWTYRIKEKYPAFQK